MTCDRPTVDPATRKVLAGIEDADLAARYPNGTHFISAAHARQADLASRALFAGDPVVLVYPGGCELLLTPERNRGIAGMLLGIAAIILRRRGRKHGDTGVRLPPGTRLEPRDAAGERIAA